jgi:prophage antirepressor-like protein
MNELLSFEFNEQATRVVLVDRDPWWVASDVAKVLGYRDAANLARMLDREEKATHIVSTPGAAQSLIIISESGLFAAILKSRKPEARRFRRWVTGEVLPALRRQGTYSMAEPPAAEPDRPVLAMWDSGQLHASVDCVREARRLFGYQAARLIWRRLGLPSPLVGEGPFGDPMMPDLQAWCRTVGHCTIDEAAAALGLNTPDAGMRLRIGGLLRALGWQPRKTRRGRVTVNLFTPADARAVEA